jgi:hypothetical protein
MAADEGITTGALARAEARGGPLCPVWPAGAGRLAVRGLQGEGDGAAAAGARRAGVEAWGKGAAAAG